MMGNECDHQEEDCYNGDEDASRDPRSVETRTHAKRGHPTHTKHYTYRRGYARWPSSLVRSCPETRRRQRHPQSDGAGNTRCQTTRTAQEDVASSNQRRHDGRGCYPECGPREKRVETKDTADPFEIGKDSFYVAHYPVRWTAQSASHFLPSLTDLFIPTPFSASPGSILARQQLRAKTRSLTFPPLSIARYSFIQLSRQGRQ